MWKIKIKAIPDVAGALGMIKKEIQKYVNKIPGNLPPTEIQKIVLNSVNYVTPKLYFYRNFIRIFLYSFIQNFLYTIFTQSKFTTIIPTRCMWDFNSSHNVLRLFDILSNFTFTTS